MFAVRLYGRKIPKVASQATWTQVTAGGTPPPGTTYDQYIICEKPFIAAKYEALRAFYECDQKATGPSNSTLSTIWSPRRHQASVFFQGYLWVLGGRAREFVELAESRYHLLSMCSRTLCHCVLSMCSRTLCHCVFNLCVGLWAAYRTPGSRTSIYSHPTPSCFHMCVSTLFLLWSVYL